MWLARRTSFPAAPRPALESATARVDGLERKRASWRSSTGSSVAIRPPTSPSSAATPRCWGAKYVITLDADTTLPPDAAPSPIGAMAHPLNRAVYDPVRQRMVHGYGILQPRVGVSLPSAHASRFASIASGHPGVDPYSVAVSDVYQDLYAKAVSPARASTTSMRSSSRPTVAFPRTHCSPTT